MSVVDVRLAEVPVPFLVTVVDHLRHIGGERERELAEKLLSFTAPPLTKGNDK